MKILFVAMADNIHTARWINQLYGSGHELHLFPAIPNRPLHPLLRGRVIYHRYPLFPSTNFLGNYANRFLLRLIPNDSQARYLIRLIRQIGPIKQILIHSLEFQSAGYLTLKAKQSMKTTFPKWLATNWGSDIYYFGKLKEHQNLIKQLLYECNYYSCECLRDIKRAKHCGFTGKSYLSTTNTGGYDLSWTNSNQMKNISDRKVIMLKGYQNWAGRAIVALQAIKCLGKQINGYELVIYNINPPNSGLIDAAKQITDSAGATLKIVPLNTEHKEILKLHGRARISIGLSLSDALSTSAIEAMVMGSFPIQSNTACIDRYVKNGFNGFLVPPEEPERVAATIKEALTNDQLLTNAYGYNQHYVTPKFDYFKLQNETLKMYQEIIND